MKLSKSDAKASAPFLLLWAIILSGSFGMGIQNGENIRLYNSRDTFEGQYPYIVFHLRREGKSYHSCSGGLIDEQWIITAGHCLKKESNPRDNIFIAGKANLRDYIQQRFLNITIDQDIDEESFELQERRGEKLFIHPLRSSTGSHDIGLVKIDKPFVLNDNVQVIPLANESFTHPTECSAIGYGLTERGFRRYHLQHIENILAKPSRMCTFQKFRDLLCLGKSTQGICRGDSGGPLICDGVLRGIASHGVSTSPKCGQGVVEQYYTDVFRNLNWVKPVMNEY